MLDNAKVSLEFGSEQKKVAFEVWRRTKNTEWTISFHLFHNHRQFYVILDATHQFATVNHYSSKRGRWTSKKKQKVKKKTENLKKKKCFCRALWHRHHVRRLWTSLLLHFGFTFIFWTNIKSILYLHTFYLCVVFFCRTRVHRIVVLYISMRPIRSGTTLSSHAMCFARIERKK